MVAVTGHYLSHPLSWAEHFSNLPCMSGDKRSRLLHAEYVLSTFSFPELESQSALAGWLLHHQRKGPVDDFWVWSIRSFRAVPVPVLFMPPSPPFIFHPKMWKGSFKYGDKTGDVCPHKSVEWVSIQWDELPKKTSDSLQGWYRVWHWNEGLVARFRLALYSRETSQALYIGEWVTDHSAQ